MMINPVSPSQTIACTQPAPVVKAEDTAVEPEVSASPETEIAGETEEVVSDAEQTRGEGVLRLLQEGHFKGVADVRLRINFHEEIAAMEAEKAARVAGDGVSGLAGDINGQIDAYLETVEDDSGAVIAEAQQLLSNEMTAAVDEIESGEKPAVSELTARLQTAFDDFVLAIKPAEETPDQGEVDAPAEETPLNAVKSVAPADEETTEITENETETGLSLDRFISALTDLFNEKLAELETSLGDISVLPELSEPSGNGKAYRKFVNIYNQMQGATGTESEPAEVDRTA